MGSEAIALPDPEPLKAQGMTVVEQAQAIRITCHDDFLKAAEHRKRILGVKDAIEKFCEPVVTPAYKTWKAATAQRAMLLEYPEKALKIVSAEMGRWDMEQERQRRIDQAEREAAEKRRQDEAAIREAAAREDAGDHRGAAQVIEQAAVAPAPVIEVPKQTAPGTSMRKNFKWRPKDEPSNPCPTCGSHQGGTKRKYLIRDEVAIGKVVRAMGYEAAEIIGGIEVYEERIVSQQHQTG